MYASCRRVLSHGRPSPSLVLSSLALFFAVSGVASSTHANSTAGQSVVAKLIVKRRVSTVTTVPSKTDHTFEGTCPTGYLAIAGGYSASVSLVAGSNVPIVYLDQQSNNVNEWDLAIRNPALSAPSTVQASVECLGVVNVTVGK